MWSLFPNIVDIGQFGSVLPPPSPHPTVYWVCAPHVPVFSVLWDDLMTKVPTGATIRLSVSVSMCRPGWKTLVTLLMFYSLFKGRPKSSNYRWCTHYEVLHIDPPLKFHRVYSLLTSQKKYLHTLYMCDNLNNYWPGKTGQLLMTLYISHLHTGLLWQIFKSFLQWLFSNLDWGRFRDEFSLEGGWLLP